MKIDNYAMPLIRDDFQSVLRTLESLFAFCFDSCRMSQNVTFRNYLHEVNSNFVLSDIT